MKTSPLPVESPRWITWRIIKRKRRDGTTKNLKQPYDHMSGRGRADVYKYDGHDFLPRNKLPPKLDHGWVLGRDGKLFYIGFDFDTCRDKQGNLLPWAREALDILKSYAEVSPSGTGFKVWAIVDEPTHRKVRELLRVGDQEHGRKKWDTAPGEHPPGIMLCLDGYFTVTGDALGDWTVRKIDLAAVQRVIGIGERIKYKSAGESRANGKASGWSDETGNGLSWRLAIETRRAGGDIEDFALALEDCPEGLRSVEDSTRGYDRQLQRDWDGACEKVDAEESAVLHRFEDLGDAPKKNLREEKTPDVPPHIAELNETHVFVMLSGKAYIVTESSRGVTYSTPTDLNHKYANRKFRKAKGNGQFIEENIAEDWMQHKHRRQCLNGVVFKPAGSDPDEYNLWRGFSVTPDPDLEKCKLFLGHLRAIVCAGDRSLYDWVLRWMAHMVQWPEEKPGVALVLKGIKGVGKDTVGEYLGRMFTPHYTKVSNPKHLIGHFNFHLAYTLLVHVEEGQWAGDKQAEGVLKNLITSPRLPIEKKGVDVSQMDTCFRVAITSNEDWAIPATADERRFCVCLVDMKHTQDPEYFVPLYDEMKGRGPAALLHYLKRVDLSGFNVRKPPVTQGLIEQKIETLKNADAWWLDVLREGVVLGGGRFDDLDQDWLTGPISVDRDAFYGAYTTWYRQQHYQGNVVSSSVLSRKIKEWLPSFDKGRRGGRGKQHWTYLLPSLQKCRSLFEKKLGGPVRWGVVSEIDRLIG